MIAGSIAHTSAVDASSFCVPVKSHALVNPDVATFVNVEMSFICAVALPVAPQRVVSTPEVVVSQNDDEHVPLATVLPPRPCTPFGIEPEPYDLLTE